MPSTAPWPASPWITPGNPDVVLRYARALVNLTFKSGVDVSQTAPILNQLNRLVEGLSTPDAAGYMVDYMRGFLEDEDVTRLPDLHAAAVAELGEDAPFSRVLTALLATALRVPPSTDTSTSTSA